MFETLAVLIVFFFLLVFGISFYFVLQRGSYNRQVERNAQLISVELTQKISDIPELDCALAGIQIDNCIDMVKLQEFNAILQNSTAAVQYFDLLGYSKITAAEIYPEILQYELYDRQPDAFSTAYKNNVPMLLYNPISRKFSFGILEVMTYVG